MNHVVNTKPLISKAMNRDRFFLHQFVVLLILLVSVAAKSQRFTICYEDQNYPPYTYQQQKTNAPEHAGMLIDIVSQAAQRANIELEFIRRPWQRCQSLVRNNHAQALFGIIKTPERALHYRFPSKEKHYLVEADYPIFFNRQSKFSNEYLLKHLTMANNLFDPVYYRKVKQYGLAAPTGYVVYNKLKQQALLTKYNYSLSNGMLALSTNRIDGYIVEKLIGLTHVKQQGLQAKIFASDIIFLQKKWHIAFNRTFYQEHQLEIESFWHAIPLVRAQVLARHFSDNIQ